MLNPQARGARLGHLDQVLSRVANGASVRVTSAAGEAEVLAREAARSGFRTVVAAGGDGTINEVVRGLVGTEARLGVLPLGTANVFARELGIPLDWEEALLRLRSSREVVREVGWANDAPFIQLAGVGFDADVVASVDSTSKREWGPLAYVAAGMRLLGGRGRRLRVSAEGFSAEDVPWVLVGVGRYYGGPLPFFPQADAGDGKLDVLVVERMEGLAWCRWMWRLPWGGHVTVPGVRYFQSAEVAVDGGEAVQLDGEWHPAAGVRFRVGSQALRVVV